MAKYFESFYTPAQNQKGVIEGVLKEVKILKLSEDHVQILNTIFTLEEIQEAIRNLQSNTAPGPDGFTVEFYKIFSTQLAPILKDLYEGCMVSQSVPPSWALAKIKYFSRNRVKT